MQDRSLLRANPYLVIEGALIAAHVLASPRIVIATKAIYGEQVARLHAEVQEGVKLLNPNASRFTAVFTPVRAHCWTERRSSRALLGTPPAEVFWEHRKLSPRINPRASSN